MKPVSLIYLPGVNSSDRVAEKSERTGRNGQAN